MTCYNLNNFMFTNKFIHEFILQETCKTITPTGVIVSKEKSIYPKSISLQEILSETKNHFSNMKLNKIKSPTLKKRFVPRKNDSLFWIFYIIINGFTEYELIGTNEFETEQTEKYKYIDFLRKKESKQLLKEHKFTKIKEEIETDLGNSSKINYKTFFALCICYKLNILFIYRKRCFQIHSGNPEDPIHVVHQYDPPIENPHGRFKYAYEIEPTKQDIEKYQSTEYFNWENIDKPLRCISYYKVKDLLDICVQLKMKEEDYNKLTKPEVYELILRTI